MSKVKEAALKIVNEVKKNDKLLPEVIKGVSSEKGGERFLNAKVLRILSEESPELIYPYWDHFVETLESGNTFLMADAAYVLSNLVGVDKKGRFEKIFDTFYSQMDEKSMINCANAVGASGKIAKAKPELETRIVDKLLDIDKTHHGTECKNIIKGDAIEAFSEFFEQAKASNKKRILDFVKEQLKNRRPGTRKKAELFLKKHVTLHS